MIEYTIFRHKTNKSKQRKLTQQIKVDFQLKSKCKYFHCSQKFVRNQVQAKVFIF